MRAGDRPITGFRRKPVKRKGPAEIAQLIRPATAVSGTTGGALKPTERYATEEKTDRQRNADEGNACNGAETLWCRTISWKETRRACMLASSATQSAKELLAAIQSGPPNQAEEALTELEKRAESSNDPARSSELAQGYFAARRFDEANRLFDELIRFDPARDEDRLNLAMCFWQLGHVALCRHQLAHLSAHAASDAMRAFAADQLRHYETALGLRGIDKELAELQEASLREQIASNDAEAAAYTRLARLLIRQGRLSGDADGYASAASVLEDGRRRFASEAPILELLVFCYLNLGRHGPLDEVIRDLERVDPESDILRTLRAPGNDQSIIEQRMARVNALFQEATSGEGPARDAALNGMREIVAHAPGTAQYRLALAFALLANDGKSEALKHAEIVAEQQLEEHSTHFNLGQIFWLTGDGARGRQHLELALRFATSEEERQDTLERISDLETR